jgi:hypothetical protein
MKSAIYLGLSMLTAAMALAPVQQAQAFEYQQNAAGQCVGALPAYQSNLRFSPYAVTNNGTTGAFVTCSSMNSTTNSVSIYGVFISNPTGADVDVSCTFAPGANQFRETTIPRTQTYPAGGAGFMVWNAATDNGGVNWERWANVSCILPPGLSMDFTATVTSGEL